MITPDDLRPFTGPIPNAEPDAVAAVLAADYGLTGALTPLAGERDQNLLLEAPEGRFVVKVANAAEDPAALAMQHAALEHVARIGAFIAFPELRRTEDGRRHASVDADGTPHALWVQTHLNGTPWRDVAASIATRRSVGDAVARVQHALQGVHHPAAGRRLVWDVRLRSTPDGPLGETGDAELDALVAGVDRRVAKLLPSLAMLPAQVVHHDLNPDNLLGRDDEVVGVVDFGDMLHGPRVLDLAVAAAYQLFGAADPAVALADVVAGYATAGHDAAVDLSMAEVAAFLLLVAARLCRSVTMAARQAHWHPDNAEYLGGDAAPAAAALAVLESADHDAVYHRLLLAAGVPRPVGSATGPIREGRRRSLGPGLRLSYDEPLHLVAGQDVWLWDAGRRRYLDAYNNVVQLGHGHPLVARTAADNIRRLNTNTRYLTEPPVRLAQRLVEMLPQGLDVCLFTNSGSEANDLAVRIARAVTGHDGVIVTEHAYHGATAVTAAMSPEELGDAPLETWVATMAPPGREGTVGDGIEGAVADLAQRGHAPAALFLDTIFSSDGIHDPPAAYLDEAAAGVRAAGGLYVADEVQAGLGRLGERLWGLAAGYTVPDIVTLGKPLGNGHPIGAVITTRDIAERFATRAHFFSTFGGNSVATAVALAVVDATIGQGLPARVEAVGGRLRAALEELAAAENRLGDVRGAGLFLGVDVVDATGRPDGPGAHRLVEAMKDRRVLIGRTGRHGHVLKIRPPLVFGDEHADLLVAALADAAGRPGGPAAP